MGYKIIRQRITPPGNPHQVATLPRLAGRNEAIQDMLELTHLEANADPRCSSISHPGNSADYATLMGISDASRGTYTRLTEYRIEAV